MVSYRFSVKDEALTIVVNVCMIHILHAMSRAVDVNLWKDMCAALMVKNLAKIL